MGKRREVFKAKGESMKKLTLLSLIGVTLLSADVVEDSYKSLIGKSIFTSSNFNLKTGHYNFEDKNGDEPELSNSNFVGSYFFGEKTDLWRPFVEGGFGFSTIEQDNLAIGRGVDGDSVEFKSTYLQIGGGINYNPTCDFGFLMGGKFIWMDSDGDYKTVSPLTGSSTDERVKSLFDSNSQTSLYEVYGGFVYHPVINGYNTELKSLLHYTTIDFDHGVDSIDGIYLNMLMSFHGKEFARVLNQPLWFEYYAGGEFLSGDLADVVGFDNALSVGTSLHWRFAPLISFLRGNYRDLDLSLNLQGSVGNRDFRGWKVGVGLNLVKF
jgi:hypothetical protein